MIEPDLSGETVLVCAQDNDQDDCGDSKVVAVTKSEACRNTNCTL
jgi:hypothetical protein